MESRIGWDFVADGQVSSDGSNRMDETPSGRTFLEVDGCVSIAVPEGMG